MLSLPAVPVPRYYVNQWFDGYTHNFAYIGVWTTGREAGNDLFVGPRCKGVVQKGITKVLRPETEFIGTLTRTQLDGPDDIAAMQAMQAQYQLTPLSRLIGKPAPKPAPPVAWPAWDAKKAEGIGFINDLNALLPFMPTVPAEKAAFVRFAKIGIGPGKPFDPDKLDPATRTAIEQGIAEAFKELKEKALAQTESTSFFGTRSELGADYLMSRSIGAMLGVYSNTKEEAVDVTQQSGPDGQVLDGRKPWVLRFEPGQLPPVNEFWSITMYTFPQRLLAENPINRYSVGDRTPGLKRGPDGSLEMYVQSDDPGPDKASKWLPAPKGPFFFVARLFGPKQAAIDGTWKLPPLAERP